MAQSHLSELDDVQEFIGFATNPAPLLVAQYERIAREEMQGLPFYHATMPIVAECTLFEDQWLGCVLTPWMLSVVVLPGPDQLWPVRSSSDRLALQLPCGNMTFMVGELPETGQLLSCSLMSPRRICSDGTSEASERIRAASCSDNISSEKKPTTPPFTAPSLPSGRWPRR